MTKKNRNRTNTAGKSDPHAAREAERYAKPIASRELILSQLDELGRPASMETIAEQLHIQDENDLEALRRRLRAMVRDGQLVFNRRGGYCLAGRVGVIAGTVQAHRDGFGFLIPDEGGDDIFLSPRQMSRVMHGDRISVRIKGIDQRGRREGSLVDVLERNTRTLVGRYFRESGVGMVIPDNSRFQHELLIPESERGDARHGQIVLADIIEYPAPNVQPLGRIREVLGEHRAAGMEVEIAIHSFGLPYQFPDEVTREANAFGAEVPEAAKQGRLDLRNIELVTIDGEDARDFDDAVYCKALSRGGWRLLVAIADVAHYVTPGSALDIEAENRATSVYFPDWVIPMLPEALSNGLCSLNPEVDRLCMVCDMEIGTDGKVRKSTFHNAVMRSVRRLTYTTVGALLESGDAEVHRAVGPLADRLHALHDLYRVMAKARNRRGAIDFDSIESKIVFDEDRKIKDILPVERNVAHRIIEECMIAANVEAAKFLHAHEIPALYRVHDGPKEESLEDVRSFLGPLGLSLGGGTTPAPKDYAKLIENVRERPDRDLIETVLLRSLSRAEYKPEGNGHFGLALRYYAHFTSPIRRYPDLLVHRGIKHVLQKKSAEKFQYDRKRMETLGAHCSMAERRADDATRDAVAWLKCDYMRDRIGQEFDGIITSVAAFGLFVELKGMHVEGLVHVTALENDYYRYDNTMHRLVGERSGLEFRLADPIRVRVARVDADERKIDFEPIITSDMYARSRLRSGDSRAASKTGKGKSGKKANQPAAAKKTTGKTTGKRKRSSRGGKKKG